MKPIHLFRGVADEAGSIGKCDERFALFSGHFFDHLFIGMVDEFEHERIVEPFKPQLVPVAFVAVIGRFDGGMAFAQFDGTLRVAFENDAVGLLQIDDGKHFVHHFEHKRVFVERETFARALLREAIGAQDFDVHG